MKLQPLAAHAALGRPWRRPAGSDADEDGPRAGTVTRPAESGERIEVRLEAHFEREYPRLVGIAYRVLGDQGEAEDAAADAFVALLRQRRQPDSIPAWLQVTTLNGALNRLRSRRRRVDRETRVGLAHLHERSAEDPAGLAEAGERRRLVIGALRALPERHARILALRYSGLSYTEVAAALGIGINQVGTRLSRAEAALLKQIQNLPGGPEALGRPREAS